MLSLQDLLGLQQGEDAIGQISRQVGAEPTAVNSAIQYALPAILGGLARNASEPQGAESLDEALSTDHDGSILGNLGGLGSMIFGQEATPRQADAGGILGHILGGSQGNVAQEVSNRTGLETGKVAQILMMLAPIVMGYLGQRKQEQSVGADGLGGLLGGLLGAGQSHAATAGSGNPMMDLANSMLDRDGDGSSMDDIASMAFDYISKRN